MRETPRRKPYIWVSWVTGLMASTDKCMWRAWYKSHFKYAKLNDTAERAAFLKEWTEKHDAMTAARVAATRAADSKLTIRVEDENSFTLDGKGGTLSGKPDIVILDAARSQALVIDEKSGKPRDSDIWQVLIYMFALPFIWASGWEIRGKVEYRGSIVDVTPDRLVACKPRIVEVIKIVSSEAEPSTAPSSNECRFCDILHCADRYTTIESHGDASEHF